MATKRKRKSDEVKARKKKKGIRLFLLALVAATGIGFLAFMGITLYDFIQPSVDKDSPFSKKAKHQVVLYFSDSNERFLVAEKRLIPWDKTVNGQAEALVRALIDGPGEGLKTGMVRVFPEGTVVRSIKVEKDGTAVVDFEGAGLDKHPGGSSSEVASVYALTNTLILNLPLIKAVSLRIDGKVTETLKGHVDTRFPFTYNKNLIKEHSPAD